MSNISNIAMTKLLRALNNAVTGADSDTAFTEGDKQTLSHIQYNPVTDLLESDRAIRTTLNSFYLGGQHKISSGSANIFFTNLTSDVNYYPMWGGIKDQSLEENQNDTGVSPPTARVYGSYGIAPLGGLPEFGTSIPYEGNNYFEDNISGVGITTIAAEVVPAHIRLKYQLSVDGTPVYEQVLSHTGLVADQTLSWFFDHPLDVLAGSSNHASIRKIDVEGKDLGPLYVCKGKDILTWGGVRYQTDVQKRGFEDKIIAYTNDLEALDVIGYYDLYVDPGYTGTTSNGSNIKPYTSLATAIGLSKLGDKIFIKGENIIASEITLPSHSLSFYGIDGTKIRFDTYDSTKIPGGNLFKFVGDSDTNISFIFKNIEFNYASEYAINIKGQLSVPTPLVCSVDIIDCKFRYNGWNGTNLNTVLPKDVVTLRAGYDSTDIELQNFYASTAASDGGAMRLENVNHVQIIGNRVLNNLRGIRISDCGINGNGFITRNVSAQNIESGIYLAAGPLQGCQNVTVTMNFSAYNANNGLLAIGGINNKFSQNEVNGNWNAGFCAWGSSNTTLRDCGLYDNNRSTLNGIGNEGDAKASVQIKASSTYTGTTGTTLSINNAARFICEILDTQIHYTGLGSNTNKIGVLISSGVGGGQDNEKNIIKIDDVGFIGQSVAIDLSEVNVTDLRLSLGDNSYQNIGLTAVNNPLVGNYSELPFSNHVMAVPELDIDVDDDYQMISLKDGQDGNVINSYKINELKSIDMGSTIDIILKSSKKIQLRGIVLGKVYLNGVLLTTPNSISSLNDTINGAFNMNLIQYKDYLVSNVGMNAGETLPAQINNWYISYGDRENEQIVASSITAGITNIRTQQPFYNGNFLEKGHEYTWTHDSTGEFIIGIYSGTPQATDEQYIFNSSNWSVGFRYVRTTSKITSPVSYGVTINSNNDTSTDTWDVTNNTVYALRYGNDYHLYLLDITDGNELIIGRSNILQVGDSLTIFFGGENQPNATFPVMIERTERWSIVHDLDNSQNGEWINGLENHTIIKSNMDLNPGEKITLNFNYSGRNEAIGIGYTGAGENESNANTLITSLLNYNTARLLTENKGVNDNWTWNVDSSAYSPPPNHIGYYTYLITTSQNNLGLVSFRYKTDNTLELWHETYDELIATLTAPLDGTFLNIYIGSSEATHTADRIPELNKYDLTATEEGTNQATWYYIESPVGSFTYPLFVTTAEANFIDSVAGGSGKNQGYSWGDTTGVTWFGPETGFFLNSGYAPTNGDFGNSTNVSWNEIPTNDDSTNIPSAYTDQIIYRDESTFLNFSIHQPGSTFITTIASDAPAWIIQTTDNGNITGQAPFIDGDSTNFPSTIYTVNIIRTFTGYGNSTGTLTIIVNNLTPLVPNLPGFLHTGSVVDGDGTVPNTDGTMWLGDNTDMPFVYDIVFTLEDGDSLEWYHRDQYYCYGIVKDGIDKETDVAAYNIAPGSRWDLLAPFTGVPGNTQGQNFGTVYSGWIGLLPFGWTDNATEQISVTSNDRWKLYNHDGTIQLSLNDYVFRTSSLTNYENPTITMAMPAQISGGSFSLPNFIHMQNTAEAPSGFTIVHGNMDTTNLLNGNSVVSVDDLTLSPGQRFIATKAWFNTNVLPNIDGESGYDNRVFVGVPKSGANLTVLVEQDFYALHRLENQNVTNLLTKITHSHGGTSPEAIHINRYSNIDILYNLGIEFTHEGNIVLMRSFSPDFPSLTTEPVGGSFDHDQTWIDAHNVTGTNPLGLVIGTKEIETRVALSVAGLSVIAAPLPFYQVNVTKTNDLPLFNGVDQNTPGTATPLTYNVNQIYKFWLDSSTIDYTDSLGFCLISDNSIDYTTYVTPVGIPGNFGSYVEFDIPDDVPPIKFKWTSDGVAYYVTMPISGSTYSTPITGINHNGPATLVGTTATVSTWATLQQTITKGERLIIPDTFINQLFNNMDYFDHIFIGYKDPTWDINKNPGLNGGSDVTGFAGAPGGIYIKLYVDGSGTKYAQLMKNGLGVADTTPSFNSSTPITGLSFFLELTGSGNNIRGAWQYNGNNITTTTWVCFPITSGASNKDQTGGSTPYGFPNLDVGIFYGKNSGAAPNNEFDFSLVTWPTLYVISLPQNPGIITPWDKAIEFNASSEYLSQVNPTVGGVPMMMGGAGGPSFGGVSAPTTIGHTTSDLAGRPWATTVVFKLNGLNANAHIWNFGEGGSSGDNNIYLAVKNATTSTAAADLKFAWGQHGEGHNVLTGGDIVLEQDVWYGIYIAYNGARFNPTDATAINLASTFDIRLMSEIDCFTTISSNLSTPTRWGIQVGETMNEHFGSSELTIGGRGITRNLEGKIAGVVSTTLMLDTAMPDDAEIKLIITDPIKWRDNTKVNYPYRASCCADNFTSFQLSQAVFLSTGSTQIWLMGNGSSDTFGSIRNQISDGNTTDTHLIFNNMSSNDIETVNIDGLT